MLDRVHTRRAVGGAYLATVEATVRGGIRTGPVACAIGVTLGWRFAQMPANNVTCDPHIIAVFGGGTVPQEVLRFAQDLGRAIADRGQILLTGGRGRPNVQKREDGTSLYAVKTCAIAGVGSRPWIGVDRTVARWDANPVPERGLLIDTPLKHRRNFLEAKMCDAAIVLEGDVGTRSELAAALLLDRPVAIVGLKWKTRPRNCVTTPPRHSDCSARQ